MSNAEKGLPLFLALDALPEVYVTEAELPDTPAEKPSLWDRINTNGWVAAAIGLVVALGVVVLIVLAGRGAGGPGIAGTSAPVIPEDAPYAFVFGDQTAHAVEGMWWYSGKTADGKYVDADGYGLSRELLTMSDPPTIVLRAEDTAKLQFSGGGETPGEVNLWDAEGEYLSNGHDFSFLPDALRGKSGTYYVTVNIARKTDSGSGEYAEGIRLLVWSGSVNTHLMTMACDGYDTPPVAMTPMLTSVTMYNDRNGTWISKDLQSHPMDKWWSQQESTLAAVCCTRDGSYRVCDDGHSYSVADENGVVYTGAPSGFSTLPAGTYLVSYSETQAGRTVGGKTETATVTYLIRLIVSSGENTDTAGETKPLPDPMKDEPYLFVYRDQTAKPLEGLLWATDGTTSASGDGLPDAVVNYSDQSILPTIRADAEDVSALQFLIRNGHTPGTVRLYTIDGSRILASGSDFSFLPAYLAQQPDGGTGAYFLTVEVPYNDGTYSGCMTEGIRLAVGKGAPLQKTDVRIGDKVIQPHTDYSWFCDASSGIIMQLQTLATESLYEEGYLPVLSIGSREPISLHIEGLEVKSVQVYGIDGTRYGSSADFSCVYDAVQGRPGTYCVEINSFDDEYMGGSAELRCAFVLDVKSDDAVTGQ